MVSHDQSSKTVSVKYCDIMMYQTRREPQHKQFLPRAHKILFGNIFQISRYHDVKHRGNCSFARIVYGPQLPHKNGNRENWATKVAHVAMRRSWRLHYAKAKDRPTPKERSGCRHCRCWRIQTTSTCRYSAGLSLWIVRPQNSQLNDWESPSDGSKFCSVCRPDGPSDHRKVAALHAAASTLKVASSSRAGCVLMQGGRQAVQHRTGRSVNTKPS